MADYDLSSAAFESYEGDSYEGDSYDPSVPMSYDPSVANNFGPRRFPKARAGAPTQAFRQSPRQAQGPSRAVPEAQVTLTIVNTSSSDQTIELFNWQNSYTKYYNPSVYGTIQPVDAINTINYKAPDGAGGTQTDIATLYGVRVAAAGTALTGSVGFANNGDLNQYSFPNQELCSIHCDEVPYRALFEWTASGILKIKKMRIDSSNATQLKQNMSWFKQTILGAKTSQNIPFNSAKDPYQFQTTIVDINNSYTITKEMGLAWNIKAETTATITMFIELWSAGV